MSTPESYPIPIQNLRGTYDKLRTNNPILLAGLIGIEKDTNRFKIGDGTTPWNSLKYANAPIVEMGRVPAATDNTFPVGQVWKNTTGTKKFYMLASVEEGTAVWHQVLTSDDLTSIGDMRKDIYDTNDDGQVDAADKADKLSTARNIAVTGDATGSASFDGSANADINVTLADSGVTAGTYTKTTVDSKGRVTTGSQIDKSDVGLSNVDNVQQASKAEFDTLAGRVTDAELDIARAEEIAKGAAKAKVFATVEAMNTWLEDEENTDTLAVGDNMYIIDREVPDYWWDGTQAQELETQKVSLVDYPKTTEVQALIATHAGDTTAHITAGERAAWNAKADAENAQLTGTPVAPTAAVGTKTQQLATTAFVFNTLSNMVIDGGDLG